MFERQFHVAKGPLPGNESGLSGRVQVKRGAGGKLEGVFQLDTAQGPLVLTASLEGVRALPLRAAVSAITQGLAGHHHAEHPHHHAHGHARAEALRAHALRARLPNLPAPQHTTSGRPWPEGGLSAGQDEVTPYRMPARLYAKLLEKDPRAIGLMRELIAKAQTGDARAVRLWGEVCKLHNQSKALDFTRATEAQKAAAQRLHLRFHRGDPAAKAEIDKLMELVAQGNPAALLAWKLVCMCEEEHKSRVSGAELSPERVRQLLQIVTMARYADPPLGLSLEPMATSTFPGAYPGTEPATTSPGGGGGLYSSMAFDAPKGPAFAMPKAATRQVATANVRAAAIKAAPKGVRIQ